MVITMKAVSEKPHMRIALPLDSDLDGWNVCMRQ